MYDQRNRHIKHTVLENRVVWHKYRQRKKFIVVVTRIIIQEQSETVSIIFIRVLFQE